MKKIIRIILIVAIAIISLVGCDSTDKTSSSSTASTASETSSVASVASTANTESTTSSVSSITNSASSNKASSTSTASTTTTVRGGNPYTAASSNLSGTISISGSTSVYPVIAALSEAFKAKYPKVSINITNVTGSGAGKADALANKVSFGMYSAEITDSTLNVYQIALDGVALVVNTGNPLTDISYEQLERIYNTTAGLTVNGVTLGTQISNWNELGISYNNPIVAVSRESGSGTRTCFEDILKEYKAANGTVYKLGSSYDSQAGRTEIAASTDQVKEKVVGNPNAIGYMSLGSVNSAVKKLKFNGVEATTANVLNKTYKFSRPFNLLTKANDKLTAVENEFLKFALSSDGQSIVEKSHFISLDTALINAQLAKVPK